MSSSWGVLIHMYVLYCSRYGIWNRCWCQEGGLKTDLSNAKMFITFAPCTPLHSPTFYSVWYLFHTKLMFRMLQRYPLLLFLLLLLFIYTLLLSTGCPMAWVSKAHYDIFHHSTLAHHLSLTLKQRTHHLRMCTFILRICTSISLDFFIFCVMTTLRWDLETLNT